MPFETFDLGRALSTAETIKGLRRQSYLDQLQEQALRGNIAHTAGSERRAQEKFSQEQQVENTRILVRSAQSVVDAQDPTAQAHAVIPELHRRGIIDP